MQAFVYERGAARFLIATLAAYNQGGERLDTFSGRRVSERQRFHI
jgi:hypothetical protein